MTYIIRTVMIILQFNVYRERTVSVVGFVVFFAVCFIFIIIIIIIIIYIYIYIYIIIIIIWEVINTTCE